MVPFLFISLLFKFSLYSKTYILKACITVFIQLSVMISVWERCTVGSSYRHFFLVRDSYCIRGLNCILRRLGKGESGVFFLQLLILFGLWNSIPSF